MNKVTPSITERCKIRDQLKHELHYIFTGYSVQAFLSTEFGKLEAILYKPGQTEIILQIPYNYDDLKTYVLSTYPELFI